MRKLTMQQKAAAAIAVGAVTIATVGTAWAYYRSDISSAATNGTAAVTSTTPSNVVATLKTGASGLVPGNGTHDLVVTLTNPNAFAVDVSNKTLTLDFANATSSVATCTPALPAGSGNTVALLSASPVTGYSHIFGKSTAGDDTDADDVTFAVSMADSTTVNQQPCNGVTLTIPVVAS